VASVAPFQRSTAFIQPLALPLIHNEGLPVTLPSGTRVGQYEIATALGAGGMGEVYRALDTRLGRTVAVKILPEAFASDADRLARFEREAKILASLNHPNIAQVYGFEDRALVMELLEGTTLRERLEEGSLPVRKAVEYAVQIARGLAAAHERGIVHRDLKPENVFVTSDGYVKLLDFGLARAIPGRADVTQTVMSAQTDAGIVMGTVGYMAPEQVRGQALDARADLFAFGAVLYEMLVGQRAFRRDTAAETMTAILREEPADLLVARADLPLALERIVRHCLEKNPAERFQTARDVAFALEALSASGSSPSRSISEPAVPVARGPSRERWIWITACAALTTAAAWLAWNANRVQAPTPPASAYRAIVLLPEGTTLSLSPIPSLALAVAPDGDRLAYVGTDGRTTSIRLLSFADGKSRELAGTGGGHGPYWTPDGTTLSFTVGVLSKRLELAAERSTDFPAPYAEYADNGQILTHTGTPGAWTVGVARSQNSPITPLFKPSKPGESFVGARWLPDGQHFVFERLQPGLPPRVELGSVDGGEPSLLVDNAITPIVAAGHLLYGQGDRLLAQPLDLANRKIVGTPVVLAERMDVTPNQAAGYSASDRVIAYSGDGTAGRSRLTWMDRGGSVMSSVSEDGDYSNLELSHDSRRLAVSLTEPSKGSRDIYLVDLVRGVRQRLTTDPSDERSVAWMPDGRQVIYNSRGLDLYRRASDFSGNEEALLVEGTSKDPRDVSFDGSRFLYRRSGSGTGNDIWIMPLSGDRTPRPLVQTPANENYASFSPDARSMVFVSDESGVAEVYVMSLERAGGKVQVSTKGGSFPRWRNPKEIVYVAPDQTLMSVGVAGSGDAFAAGVPAPLFKINAAPGPGTPFDMVADGKRFIVNVRQPSRLPPSINVIVNWTELVKRSHRP
jgi:eukaryotic-like serine/threonine-protein kinase